MPAVHPRWLTVLPDVVRFVEVAGLTLAVVLTRTERGYVATHLRTGVWGYGATADDAVADCGDALAHERRWYLDEAGAYLDLSAGERAKRAAIREVFG